MNGSPSWRARTREVRQGGLISFRQRLFATYLGLLVIGSGALAIVVLWSFQRFFMATAGGDLLARTEAISESVSELLERDDQERLRVMVRRYGAQEGIALRVIGPGGRLVATSSQDEAGERKVDWLRVAGVREGLAGLSTTGVAEGVSDDDDRIFDAVPVVRDGQVLGVVRMSRSLAQLHAHMRSTVMTVLAALAVVIGVSACVSAWLARGISRPIQQMRDFAVALGRGNLATRLSVARHDELGELASELNDMAARLAALEDERRAFLANASHELRTPVSNVHVTLQALESGAGEDPELRGRFLRTAVDETTRLRRLIQDLLDLGRLEAGTIRLERERVPLRGVVERATRAVEGRALEKQVSLSVDIDGDAAVDVDPERIAQALMCLLDNALKLSPPRSTIAVDAREVDGEAEIAIRDEGPGIEAADRPHIFEQFYTADPSRRRGGTGLGLAIARRILDAHGGSVRLISQAGVGATFAVRLPLAAPVAAAGGLVA